MIQNCASHSQVLQSHKWQDRLILILSIDTNVGLYQDQINELKKDENGLIERRLKVYKITPTEYSLGLNDNNFVESDILYKEFKKNDTQFEVFLIGLDGGIKLSKTGLLTIDELFVKIDGMTMRRKEIRQKNQKK